MRIAGVAVAVALAVPATACGGHSASDACLSTTAVARASGVSDVRPPGAPYGITSRTTTTTFDGTLCSYRLFADGKELNLTIAYATRMNGKSPTDYVPVRDAEISSHQSAGTTIDIVELPTPSLPPMREVKMVRRNKGSVTAVSGLLGSRFVSVAVAATDGVPSSVDLARTVVSIAAAVAG